MFSGIYNKVLSWARAPHAPWYLAALSFTESSFFPIPPDVMLAPMALANRAKAWRYALLTTVASVLGAVLGYAIGMFLYQEVALPVIHLYHLEDKMEQVKQLFLDYDIWIIFLAGFSPIPYKLFTITAGIMGMAFWPFILASMVGRGARFFLVAGMLVFGGEKLEATLQKRIEMIGWSSVALVILLIIGIKLWHG